MALPITSLEAMSFYIVAAVREHFNIVVIRSTLTVSPTSKALSLHLSVYIMSVEMLA